MSHIFRSLFGGQPSVQAPPPPTPPAPVPTIDQAVLQQDQQDRLRRRRGAASTILVNPLGSAPATPASPVKSVLGG
jgi:hypothetical protein